MASSKTFRPDDAGARQRLLHWANAGACLLVFVVAGPRGLLAYFVGLFLLHLRVDMVRGHSAMDNLLRAREHDLAREWSEFFCANQRRAMSLAGRRPHRFVAISWLVTLLVLAAVLSDRVGDASVALAVALRSGIALAGSAALWFAFFGLGRRTALIFGTDGVRVRETFVAYSTVIGFRRQRGGLAIERSSPLPAILIGTSDVETADRLVSLLTAERDRARRKAAEPSRPLPVPGFRESASQVGWRVRVLDAASEEERSAVLGRVPPEELRELLDETADPALEAALHAQLRNTR